MAKIIHYVWFGGNKPESLFKCIDTWKKTNPDYKIVEWNETNFEYKKFSYTDYHFRKKNWAAVSDFIRIWAVYNFGGIYLDTDVELLNSLKPLNKFDFFISRTSISGIAISTFGAKKKNKIVHEVLKIMDSKKMAKKFPRIICGNIFSFVLSHYFSIDKFISKKTIVKNNVALISEDILQFGLENSIAKHLHFANWKGKGDFKESKWLDLKINNFYKELTNKEIITKKKNLLNDNKLIAKIGGIYE